MASKIILITRGSSGFGNITAKLLAQNGHRVFATMRDMNGINHHHKQEWIERAKVQKVNLKVLALDVTSDQRVENAKNPILTETNGSLDVSIHNAGIYGIGIQEAFTVNDYKALFEVHVFERFHASSEGTIATLNFPNRPEQAATAIVKRVDMPHGTRPLRTAVDKLTGSVAKLLNETAKQVQTSFLQNSGLYYNNTAIINT